MANECLAYKANPYWCISSAHCTILLEDWREFAEFLHSCLSRMLVFVKHLFTFLTLHLERSQLTGKMAILVSYIQWAVVNRINSFETLTLYEYV